MPCFADLDHGLRICYQLGGGGQPLVLVHGFATDQGMWDGQVEAFRQQFLTLTYDLRGFGQSSLPTGPYRHCDDLIALLDRLQIGKTHLVGLSMGGSVALNAAISYPERILSVVVAGPIMPGFRGGGKFIEDRNRVWSNAHSAGLEQTRRDWLALSLFEATLEHPQAGPRFREMLARYGGWHWLHTDPELPLAPSTYARLAEMIKPALVLVGERDLEDFHQFANAAAARLTNASLRVIPNAGHMINMEAESCFNQAVLDFVGSVAP